MGGSNRFHLPGTGGAPHVYNPAGLAASCKSARQSEGRGEGATRSDTMTVQANRREFIHALLGGAAGLSLTWPAFGQGAAPTPIVATKLTDRIAMLAGAGGNVGLVIGPGGLLMVDGGLANRSADLAKAISEVSPNMVQ